MLLNISIEHPPPKRVFSCWLPFFSEIEFSRKFLSATSNVGPGNLFCSTKQSVKHLACLFLGFALRFAIII